MAQFARLKDHIFPPSNEIPAKVYLDYLSPGDRDHVRDIVRHTERQQGVLRITTRNADLRLAVTAVGSALVSPEKRHRPVEDVDLRILNSEKAMSNGRQQVIDDLRGSLRQLLNSQGVNYTEESATVRNLLCDGFIGSNPAMVKFLDFYNNDPSFVVKPPEGLPLHVSISGIDNHDLATYLDKERKSKSRFSLLYPTI